MDAVRSRAIVLIALVAALAASLGRPLCCVTATGCCAVHAADAGDGGEQSGATAPCSCCADLACGTEAGAACECRDHQAHLFTAKQQDDDVLCAPDALQVVRTEWVVEAPRAAETRCAHTARAGPPAVRHAGFAPLLI